MVGVVRIASYICLCYQQRYGKEIDEMKLQKLLYFTRRESIILETIFKDCFEVWKYSPIMVPIRQKYRSNALHEELSPEIIASCKSVFDVVVFETYAQKD